MTELLEEKKQNKIGAVYSSDEDSDHSLDSEGYDPKDPYSSMARKIDRRNKVVEEFHQRPLIKASKKIIENRSNITYFEKHTLKYVFMIGLLAYLIISNLSQAGEYQNPRSQSKVV